MKFIDFYYKFEFAIAKTLSSNLGQIGKYCTRMRKSLSKNKFKFKELSISIANMICKKKRMEKNKFLYNSLQFVTNNVHSIT